MTYTWHFFTGERIINPVPRKCHRGPMISIEETLSQPFTTMAVFESLRLILLKSIVSSTDPAVQTRETLLRVITSTIASIFPDLDNKRVSLRAIICEKRRCTDIEKDLEYMSPFFITALSSLPRDTQQQYAIDKIVELLNSSSPIARVAGKCATILLAAYLEIGEPGV